MNENPPTVFGIPVIVDETMTPDTALLGSSGREVLRLMVEEHLTIEEIAQRYFCVIKMHAEHPSELNGSYEQDEKKVGLDQWPFRNWEVSMDQSIIFIRHWWQVENEKYQLGFAVGCYFPIEHIREYILQGIAHHFSIPIERRHA